MKYRKALKAYCADVKIRERDVFKFIVDEAFRVSKDYETTFVNLLILNTDQDTTGHESNIFILNPNYKEDAKCLMSPFGLKEVYAVKEGGKKTLVTEHPEITLPFSIYDAQSNINASAKLSRMRASNEIQENNEELEIIMNGQLNLIDNIPVVVGTMPIIRKPIPRIKTEMNLSNYEEIVEGSNGPILVNIEGAKENHEENHFIQFCKPEEKLNIVEISSKKDDIFKFIFGFSVRPRDGEEGEDACFACERGLGVADGVSGWSTYGINPAIFSRELMEESEKEIRTISGFDKIEEIEIQEKPIRRTPSYAGLDFQCNTIYQNPPATNIEQKAEILHQNNDYYASNINPMDVLTKAYNHSTAIGSSTATIVILNKNFIEAVNLGDSGYVCFTQKNGDYFINGMSKEQQHEFNVPFQLAKLPSLEQLDQLEKEKKLKEGKLLRSQLGAHKMCNDKPEQAEKYKKEVFENDILVLGTDGKKNG